MSSSEHCRWAIFQIYNVQNLKITRITTFRICNVVYQAGSRWDPKCVFNFLRFFERTLYKSNYIIFILSWCGTHKKIRSKLVDIVTAGSQKITLCGPQRTPLGILRVKEHKAFINERQEGLPIQEHIKARHYILRQNLYYTRYDTDECRLLSFSTTFCIIFYLLFYIIVLKFNTKHCITPNLLI